MASLPPETSCLWHVFYEQSGKLSNQEFNFIMFKKCYQNISGFNVHFYTLRLHVLL